MATQSRGSRKGRPSDGLAEHDRQPISRLEIRADTIKGSGRKAARLDLESKRQLGKTTPYQEGLLAAQAEAARNERERALAERGVVDEELADVECEISWRDADLQTIDDELDAAVRKRDGLPAARRVGKLRLLVYVGLLAGLASGEFPLLRLSFTRLPVDDRTIGAVSILTGAMLIVGVHLLGIAASRVAPAQGERIESRRSWLVSAVVLAGGVATTLGAVLGLAIVRASEIAAVSATFEGAGISHPVYLGVAFGLLHGLVLLAAFYLSFQRDRGRFEREVEETIRERTATRDEVLHALETAERRRERLLVRRDLIEERCEHRLARLLHHHQHEEADYLAVLGRELERPPAPISGWDDPARTTASERSRKFRNGRERWSPNGKAPRAKAEHRIKRAVRNREGKDVT